MRVGGRRVDVVGVEIEVPVSWPKLAGSGRPAKGSSEVTRARSIAPGRDVETAGSDRWMM